MSFTIQLKPSNSEKLFEIQSDEVVHSSTLRIMVEDFEDEIKSKKIAFPVEVEEFYLEKIVEWLKENKNDPLDQHFEHDPPFTAWDEQFFQIEPRHLLGIISGSVELGINLLMEQGCKCVAMLIKGKTPEELRTTFHLVNDLTPEEEENIRRQHGWVQDD